MVEIDRRKAVGMILGMGAVSTFSASAAAQDMPKGFLTPNIDNMSDSTRNRIADILMKQRLNPYPSWYKRASGPNPDPEYSEFWAEARPADVGMFLDKGGDPQIYQYWKDFEPRQFETGFAEDSFHEITPEFGEACSPDGCRGEAAKQPNTKITVFAAENGKIVEESAFYQDVLKSMRTP